MVDLSQLAIDYSPAGTQAQYSTADLNNGLTCMSDGRPGMPGNTKCISSERYDGRVRNWSELSAEMSWAATINPQYPDSARRAVWFNNPSWHFSGDVWDASRSWSFASDYKPAAIGPTQTSGGATVYIVDPNTGTKIDTTNVSDPNAPLTADGRSVRDIVNSGPTGSGANPPASDDSLVTMPATEGTSTSNSGGGGGSGPALSVAGVATVAPGAAQPATSAGASSAAAAGVGATLSSIPKWALAGIAVALVLAFRRSR
jgi:hypothetical protein